MIRRTWVVFASAALLLAGCQDANKNQPTAAKKDEPQPYNAGPSRSLDSMDNRPITPASPQRDSTYTSNPPADTYNYNEANNPPEKMAPAKSSKSKSGSAKSSSGKHTYTVVKGDTLAKIAKKMYGDESKWKKIADANKSKVPDPKKLKVGTKLVIP